MSEPYLSVAISTFGRDGIERVARMGLPEVDGVEYVVSWQQSDDCEVPEVLQSRDDLYVYRTPTVGLSRNRNNAFDRACGEVILIADDDLTYLPGGLEAVMRVFRENPQLDIATFRYETPVNKAYPTEEMDLTERFRNYYVTSFEIAVRRRVVVGKGKLKFNPKWGIGAEYLTAGEENVFVEQALRQGHVGRFFPLTIVRHDGLTTGERKVDDPGALRANGALIAYVNKWTWLPRLIVNAWRVSRAGRAPFWHSLKWMWQGAYYCKHTLRMK